MERAAYSDAWSRRTFEEELENRFARYVVAEEERTSADGPLARVVRQIAGVRSTIVGFAGVWYMVDQLHLVTIAVEPSRQGRGIGSRMLLEVFEMAIAAEFDEVVLEVRESNDRARRLYERYGFRPAGRIAGYYKDNDEDALVMTAGPLTSEVWQERLSELRSAHHADHPELW